MGENENEEEDEEDQDQEDDEEIDDEENDEEILEEDDDATEQTKEDQPLNSQISNIFGDDIDKSSNENSEEENEIEKPTIKMIDPEDFGDMEDCVSSEVDKYTNKVSGRTSRNSALKSDKTISPV